VEPESRDVRRLGVAIERLVLQDADLFVEAGHGHAAASTSCSPTPAQATEPPNPNGAAPALKQRAGAAGDRVGGGLDEGGRPLPVCKRACWLPYGWRGE
jgi:hypothetical protein